MNSVNLALLKELPVTVQRYFKLFLKEEQAPIRVAHLRNSGELRLSTTSARWLPFSADQVVTPAIPSFSWNARVDLPFGLHVRVLDGYAAGVGSGRVSLLSAFPIASDSNRHELNSGALHRYLAEAVWYPTALLPQAGVRWQSVDETTATATLTDRAVTVCLDFRFDEVGHVISIFTPARWGPFNGTYKQLPWEGHFKNYEERCGIHIPLYGEVGWYDSEEWQAVWRGSLSDVKYEFAVN
jgi:hypothetical protein